MAIPNTRDEFTEYCLRRLGHPVIEINIDDEQLEDNIDEVCNGLENITLMVLDVSTSRIN